MSIDEPLLQMISNRLDLQLNPSFLLSHCYVLAYCVASIPHNHFCFVFSLTPGPLLTILEHPFFLSEWGSMVPTRRLRRICFVQLRAPEVMSIILTSTSVSLWEEQWPPIVKRRRPERLLAIDTSSAYMRIRVVRKKILPYAYHMLRSEAKWSRTPRLMPTS